MSTQKPFKIVVAGGLSDSALGRLSAVGEVVRPAKADEATLMEAVKDADALVVRTHCEVTDKVVAVGKRNRLRVIGRAGVGLDNIDVPAAFAAGIPVVHTPAACTVAVAELVIGLMIAAQRRIVTHDARVRAGEFTVLRAGTPKNTELQHQTLGVIGMGRIGTALGSRMSLGLKMRVIYYDIRDVEPLAFPAEKRNRAEEVYAEADVVTMHVPLTQRTRGMVDAAALSHFKPGAYLINASRGPVVDGAALAEALKAGRLAGAAIDVFDPEPPPSDHPLLSAPNCILSPHVASRTQEGLAAMNDVVDDVIGVLQGRPPKYPADPEVC